MTCAPLGPRQRSPGTHTIRARFDIVPHMPSDASFDIVSELNLQEMDNAITQAQKEIATRSDFKGTAASVEFDRKAKELTLTADQEPQLEAVRKVVVEKMIKGGGEPQAMDT